MRSFLLISLCYFTIFISRSVYARRYSSTSYYKPSVGWGILKVLMRSIDELENPYVAINSSGDAVTV